MKIQEPDQLIKLTQLREISFELVAPAGELRRQQRERRVCRLWHPSLQLPAAANACILPWRIAVLFLCVQCLC